MMYPLVESLAVLNGKIMHIEWHEARFRKSYTSLYGYAPNFTLVDKIECELPEVGLYKLRLEYDATHSLTEISKYDAKPISSLKLVEDNTIVYQLKYTDRKSLQKLHSKREVCDDILIIKNGYVTDTFIGNVIFKNEKGWFTPSTPLLEGTCRARLLKQGMISETDIKVDDLKLYSKFQVINALRNFNPDAAVDINNIIE